MPREPAAGQAAEKGDDRARDLRAELRAACPDALDRLDVFYWEWHREHYSDRETGRRTGAERVARYGKPVSCEKGISRDGLADAAEQVARWVQSELHGRGDEPIDMLDCGALWQARLSYQNALYWLVGHAAWKSLEMRVSPDGVARSICVGSNVRVPVRIYWFGRLREERMHGYPGCLRAFPESPSGPGRPWARWCPECRRAKTNAKSRAITAFQKRAATLSAATTRNEARDSPE